MHPKDGSKIPFSSVSKLHIRPGYLEPKTFIPEPKEFYYKGQRAVNIKLYVKKEKIQETLLFAKELIKSDYNEYFTKHEIITQKE